MKILLHSQHRITETVVKILAEAKKLSGVEEEMQFAPLDDGFVPPKGVPVLSLGSYQRRGQERVVQTYSGPQIVTKADSLTRLSTAFQLLHKVPELPEFKYEMVSSMAQLRHLEGTEFVVDIETRGSVDAQIPGWEHVISLAVYNGDGSALVVDEELCQNSVMQAGLAKLFSLSSIILHNGKFDCKYFGPGIYPYADTMLMHYSLYPAASDHGLKPLALEYFGAEDWDSKAKKHLTGRQVKEYTVLEDGAYASPDVVYTAKNGYERIPRTMLYEYNCIAEGQLVLTDQGLVPIEDVKLSHKLWDGVEWVTHDGVILKGTRPVIELDNLVLTPDHLLLTEDGDYACAASIQHGVRRAVVGAHGTSPVRTPDTDWQGLEGEASQDRGGSMFPVWEHLPQEGQFASTGDRNSLHMSELGEVRARSTGTCVTGQIPRNGTTVQNEPGVLGEGYPDEVSHTAGVHTLGLGTPTSRHLQGVGVRQDRQLRSLRTGESETRYYKGELDEQVEHRVCGVHGAEGCSGTRMASGEDGSTRLSGEFLGIGNGTPAGGDSRGVPSETKTARVFDILNAGPRYRFTVSGVIVSNCRDVYWTWWLYQEFKVLLDNDANAKRLLDEHLMDISHMFQRVETVGTRYDKAYMEERAVELSAEAVVLEEELSIAAGHVLNPRSPKQLKTYFTEQGYKLKSTNAETLETLVMETGDEVARIVQLCRGNTKTNGTYTTGYLKQLIGDRGYPTFKIHAASTGRIGGGGPSLLTIPRDKKIKRMVLPDEGMVMVGADLSQAELRVMAIESNDPWMIAAFQPGAGDFFDLLMENTYSGFDPVAHKADDPQAYTDLRAKFKGTVYGVSFGRQAKAIAYALGITVKEAQELMDAFVRPAKVTYAKDEYDNLILDDLGRPIVVSEVEASPFALWREEITRRAVQGESIINRFGRKFQSELVTHKNQQNVINSALSFMSQSTANDICLSAAVVVEKELPSYGSRLLTTLHDALYAPAYEARADEVGKYLSDELEAAGKRVYGDTVAFKSDFGWGNNLAEA